MDNTISPMLQTGISEVKTSSTTLKQAKPNLTHEPDSVELSTKPKMSKGKKALIATGAVVGVAAVVAGAVALIQKGKFENIQKEADSIQAKSEPVKEEAEKLVNEFLEKFKKGENVETLENGTKVIQEMAQNGKDIARRATLNVDENLEFLTIDDFINKTKIARHRFFDHDVLGVSKGVEFLKNGAFKAKEGFCFEDGNLFRFCKKYQFNADTSESIAKLINFEDGKISQIKEKYQLNADWDETTAKITDFKDGKISQIKEKYHDITGGETIGKITWFENEKKVTKKNITWKLEKALPCGMEEKFTVKL